MFQHHVTDHDLKAAFFEGERRTWRDMFDALELEPCRHSLAPTTSVGVHAFGGVADLSGAANNLTRPAAEIEQPNLCVMRRRQPLSREVNEKIIIS